MKRKGWALLLTIALILTMTACGNTQETATDSTQAVSVDTGLSDEEIAELADSTDLALISEEITSVEDFYRYLKAANFQNTGESFGSAAELLTERATDQPGPFCELMVAALQDNYQETGIITVEMEGNAYKLFYLEKDDKYYAYQPDNYKFTTSCIFSSDILEGLAENCLTIDLGQGGAWEKYEIESYVGTHGSVEAPNGETLNLTYDSGTETYYFAGTTLPVGLGLPKLTDDEIDALIATEDAEKIAEALTTVPDLVNYFVRAEMQHKLSEYRVDEKGGKVYYTCSGLQTLVRNENCFNMCNAVTYCLKDYYDEIGYINISNNQDGHWLNYIKHDGIYYVLNAEIYLADVSPVRWMSDYGDGTQTWASEDLGTIAESFTEHDFHDEGDYISMVYTCKAKGDIVEFASYESNYMSELESRQEMMRYFPEGSNAKCWYGKSVKYFTAKKDWQSQTAMVSEDLFTEFANNVT